MALFLELRSDHVIVHVITVCALLHVNVSWYYFELAALGAYISPSTIVSLYIGAH